jgi:hypothetical protein
VTHGPVKFTDQPCARKKCRWYELAAHKNNYLIISLAAAHFCFYEVPSMRTVAALVLSAFCAWCAPVHAEWVPIVRESDVVAKRFALYVDAGSIVRHGERVTVRVLLNMRDKTEDGISSVVAVDEYDCLNDRMRSRSVVSYAERDGKGRVVREFRALGAWVPVEPGKINEAVLEHVCDFYPNRWSE